jgi:predicted lysophospholipase L1 biosynthesis ABC-type transport system permease subunit
VTLVKGIDSAVRDPATTGAVWDVVAQTGLDQETAVAQMDADPEVEGWALVSRLASNVGGLDAPLYSLEVQKGTFGFVTMRGRAPSGDDEVALGPATASSIHARVGDSIIVGPKGRSVRVVGIALLPATPHSAFDEGAWVSPAVVAEAADSETSAFQEYEALIRLTKGTNAEQWASTLSDEWYTEPPTPAADVLNLDQVRSLPLYLAGFLCLLAIGAAGHALLTGTRRRAHELAVLRSFGLTPRQTAACVAWQAAIIGIVALAIGVPLGIIAGRQMWRLITTSLWAVYRAPLSSPVLLLIGPAVLVALILMALWPARAAARLHTAQVLRSE